MTRPHLLPILLTLASLAPIARATTFTLYDASLNTLPESQSFLFQGTATETAPSAATPYAELNTQSAITNQAGWATSTSSLLNVSTGYTINFTVAVPTETRDPAVLNRAGFDIIVLSSDPTKSIELALWPTKIFALEGGSPTPAFTAAESANIDLTTLQNFQLSVQGSSYSLYDNNTFLMSGPLRNYTGSSATVSGIPIYTIPGFLFLGDDTTEAAADSQFQKLSLTTSPISTPEPTTLTLLLPTLLLTRRHKSQPKCSN